MNYCRARPLNESAERKGPIIYWMNRDQRANDNWALLFAQELALQRGEPLGVAFCLAPDFHDATSRQYSFMIKGLTEVEKNLGALGIPFMLLTGDPGDSIVKLVVEEKAGAIICDFDPLKIKKEWKKKVLKELDIPLYDVDTHNIVPCWTASQKQEYGAYTIRPKLKKLLPTFFEEFPHLELHPTPWKNWIGENNWKQVAGIHKTGTPVPEASWLSPGEEAAMKMLRSFIETKLPRYNEERNDPTKDGQSNLSPYLHFGQISMQRVALEILTSCESSPSCEAFLEELIIRGGLSDNFCLYNREYDNFNGFPEWARRTLVDHKDDRREYIYTAKEFERGATHDRLWNAAQTEMISHGKMHGYMRIYWAKKILEWTESPEEAIKIAIYLNDKYELDGRDPNGYAGIAWSIGGAHDRAWGERKVFGKIRYMSYSGSASKFDVAKYIEKYCQ
jgi:deoxyribodipyrimidine photo-lyase